MITIRNVRSDARWMFSTVDAEGNETGHLVVGSCIDSDDQIARTGIPRDPVYCPNPMVKLTEAEWNELRPVDRTTIRTLVAQGQFEVEMGPRASQELPPEPVAA